MSARQGLFIYTDPASMGETFSSDGRPKENSKVSHTREQREQFRMAIAVIPRRELSMMCEHLIWRKGQEEIAEHHNVTQGDVSYRIKRAKERMALWCKIDGLMKESELRQVLFEELNLPAAEITIVLGIYRTTSQSVCAKALKLTQGNVRHTYVRVRSLLKESQVETSKRAEDLLVLLAENYNRLRALEHQKRWRTKFW